MPEEKLQRYHPVLPGKVLYLCRYARFSQKCLDISPPLHIPCLHTSAAM